MWSLNRRILWLGTYRCFHWINGRWSHTEQFCGQSPDFMWIIYSCISKNKKNKGIFFRDGVTFFQSNNIPYFQSVVGQLHFKRQLALFFDLGGGGTKPPPAPEKKSKNNYKKNSAYPVILVYWNQAVRLTL